MLPNTGKKIAIINHNTLLVKLFSLFIIAITVKEIKRKIIDMKMGTTYVGNKLIVQFF